MVDGPRIGIKINNTSRMKSHSRSIIGLQFKMQKSNFVLLMFIYAIVVQITLTSILMLWENLTLFCEQLDPNCEIFVMRDFNASYSNEFGEILFRFCSEQDYILSDMKLLPSDSFTYVSDVYFTTSWLDHIMINKRSHYLLQGPTWLYNFESPTVCYRN